MTTVYMYFAQLLGTLWVVAKGLTQLSKSLWGSIRFGLCGPRSWDGRPVTATSNYGGSCDVISCLCGHLIIYHYQ